MSLTQSLRSKGNSERKEKFDIEFHNDFFKLLTCRYNNTDMEYSDIVTPDHYPKYQHWRTKPNRKNLTLHLFSHIAIKKT